MATDTTSKINKFVEDFTKTAAQIKEAQKVQRERQKSIRALIDAGFVSDEQAEALKALLPKERKSKDGEDN